MIAIILLGLLGSGTAQTAGYATEAATTEGLNEIEAILPPIQTTVGTLQNLRLLAELSPEFNETMDMVESELCSSDCKENEYFDCDCHNSFLRYNSGVEECSNLPCNLFRTLRESTWETLDDMSQATSYVKLFKAALPLAERLVQEICACMKELPTAVQGCLSGRSPLFFEMQEGLKRVKWGAVNRIWRRLVKPFCSEECGLDATLHLTKIARIIDETHADSGSCMDMNSWGWVDFVANKPKDMGLFPEPDVLRNAFEEIGEMLWCGGSRACKRELEKKFSTCCYGQLLETFNRKTIRDLRKVIVSLAEDDDAGRYLDAIIPAVLRALDPDQSTCSRRDRDCELEF